MDQQLKQRLVGVAVIFSLAVIFIPMLLDGAGTRPQHLQVEIPAQPSIEPFAIVEQKVIELKRQSAEIPDLQPRIVDEISDPPAPAVKPTPKEEKPTQAKVAKAVPEAAASSQLAPLKAAQKAPKKQPISDTQKAASTTASVATKPAPKAGGESWIIQAGSFNDKNKAYKLRNKLRKSHLASDVFIEKFPHNGQISYRVRLGMFLSRKQARVVANKLRAKYNIKGLIQQYDK